MGLRALGGSDGRAHSAFTVCREVVGKPALVCAATSGVTGGDRDHHSSATCDASAANRDGHERWLGGAAGEFASDARGCSGHGSRAARRIRLAG
ncbi:unannotated protein [freshwater metagenome]|uniref:Unannotated protein n=1 Tax=freshwater metagenome TaxID=449393 RepID=A0A6J7AWE3_9ZZZZ